MESTKIYLKIKNERPAYYKVATFLWGVDENIDSDGDSESSECKKWTELTLIKRADKSQWIEIDPVSHNPLILLVNSEVEPLVYATALYLAFITQGEWSFSLNKNFISDLSNLQKIAMKHFDVEAAYARLNIY